MGDKGRMSSFGTERITVSDSSGCSGYGDEGNEQGIRILDQEGLLPGGATAAPLLVADGLQSTINGLVGSILQLFLFDLIDSLLFYVRPYPMTD